MEQQSRFSKAIAAIIIGGVNASLIAALLYNVKRQVLYGTYTDQEILRMLHHYRHRDMVFYLFSQSYIAFCCFYVLCFAAIVRDESWMDFVSPIPATVRPF